MKTLEKLDYLLKQSGFTEKKFCKVNGISLQLFWQWKNKLAIPNKEDLVILCERNNLDVDDFMDEKSTVIPSQVKEGEHVCKLIHVVETDNYEDFPRESNDRYEEKD